MSRAVVEVRVANPIVQVPIENAIIGIVVQVAAKMSAIPYSLYNFLMI